VSKYRPKYRYIGDNIGLVCHRCQKPKISSPSSSTTRDTNTINIEVSRHHYHRHRQTSVDPEPCDATVGEIVEKTGLPLTIDDFTMLRGEDVRVPLSESKIFSFKDKLLVYRRRP
jgi:hypothetical protein